MAQARARSTAVAVAMVSALIIVSAACSGGPAADREAAGGSPAPTVRPYRAPEFDDTRGVALAAVAGGPGPLAPIPVWGGDATLDGVVEGPDGPVVGGRVRLERFVGQVSTSIEITTGRDGRWEAEGIHGGRYRVRAWRIPDVAMNESVLLFLGAEEERTLELRPTEQGGVDVQAVLSTSSPTIDQPVTLTALVTRHEVDRNGVVQATPLVGLAARVESSSGWTGVGATGTVDGEGRVDWSLTCTAASPAPLRVTAGEGSTVVEPPACRAPVGASPAPTDDVEEPVANFPVGSSFTPPFAGPLPAGSYEVTDSSGACALVYEVWTGSGWSSSRQTSTSTTALILTDFARNLETLADTPACTYRRTS